jgi:diadenylate cyclase
MGLTDDLLDWRHLADILLVAALIYMLLMIFRGTIAAQALKGLAFVAAIAIVANIFRLETLTWIIDRLATVVLIGIIILFRPELRRGLARIGERSFGTFNSFESERIIEEVTGAAVELANRKWGGLIAFERESGLEPYIETGTLLNAEVTAELIVSLFQPATPLHDGAIIIRGNTLVAAGAILPLDQDEKARVKYGTRHRAAIGLSRETDAIVVVVSEETRAISLAGGGKMMRDLDSRILRENLTLYLGGGKRGGRA